MSKREIVLDILTGVMVLSLPFAGFWLKYIFFG